MPNPPSAVRISVSQAQAEGYIKSSLARWPYLICMIRACNTLPTGSFDECAQESGDRAVYRVLSWMVPTAPKEFGRSKAIDHLLLVPLLYVSLVMTDVLIPQVLVAFRGLIILLQVRLHMFEEARSWPMCLMKDASRTL